MPERASESAPEIPPESTLFREEAIRELSARHLDARSLRPPTSILYSSVVLILILVTVATIISSLPYARKHRVMGQLDETGTIAIQATDFGYVSQLSIKEGESVVGGQVLARISHHEDERNGDGTELQNRLEQLQRAVMENSVSLSEKTHAISIQRQQTAMQFSLARKKLDLQAVKVGEMETLLKQTAELHQIGHLSNLDWLNLRTNLTSAKQHKFDLEEKLLHIQQVRQSLDEQAKTAERQYRDRKINLEIEMSRAREVLARTKEKPYQLVEAKDDGIVSRIEIEEGGTTQPGQVLIYITKDRETGSGTLLIPPVATRHLEEGEEIELELESFPRETYGSVTGYVESIPKYTVMIGRNPFYPVRVSIVPSSRIDVYLPGMTISGDIIVARKTIAEWLIAPLKRLSGTLG